MLPGTQPLTVGGDKGLGRFRFVEECRHLQVTPHVAQNLGRRSVSAIDGCTTRHSGYVISQKKRKRIEECFWVVDHCAHAEGSASRSGQDALDIYPCLCRLQSRTRAKPSRSSGDRSRGRSVSPAASTKNQGRASSRKQTVRLHYGMNNRKKNPALINRSAAC